MVESLDEEELNRLMGYLDLSRIKSESEFWEEYWHQFKGKGSAKMGDELKDRVENQVGDLPKEPKYRATYHYKGIKFERQIIRRKGKHYTIHRNKKTGRFISVK